ncbi:hypothetical protein [Marinitoga lauensis]|uniref:hypothetical protein n=1 Tax=Marinitoga lauensis TaxID=2201189 RepID=UPI0014052CEB|nr:hypothetical protein [Marinitoga lauensis]
MKKIFALVMALALLVSAFAATEVPATLSVTNQFLKVVLVLKLALMKMVWI